jgi:hypothetical protein
MFRSNIVGFAVMCSVFLFGWAYAGDVGCNVVYVPAENAYGQVTTGVGLCNNPDAVCRWYMACNGTCPEKWCMGSESTDCQLPLAVAVTSEPHSLDCDHSATYPKICKATGTHRWYGACPACSCTGGGTPPGFVNDWINGNNADVGSDVVTCKCAP